jgi:hypothetical protein
MIGTCSLTTRERARKFQFTVGFGGFARLFTSRGLVFAMVLFSAYVLNCPREAMYDRTNTITISDGMLRLLWEVRFCISLSRCRHNLPYITKCEVVDLAILQRQKKRSSNTTATWSAKMSRWKIKPQNRCAASETAPKRR